MCTTCGESHVSEWKQICVIYCHSDSLNTSLRVFKERLTPRTTVKLAGYTGQMKTSEIKPSRFGFHVEAHFLYALTHASLHAEAQI